MKRLSERGNIMPRETVHYGRDYAIITVRPTKDQSGWMYDMSAEEAKKSIATGELDKADVRFSNKPHLDVLWSRPIDQLSLPVGEEPRGAVQVQIGLNPTEMQSRIDHIAEHPEDLEAFSVFFTESLSRHQINHLIRTLKRARDAAYGSDE